MGERFYDAIWILTTQVSQSGRTADLTVKCIKVIRNKYGHTLVTSATRKSSIRWTGTDLYFLH
jgi:hypothetical protein